MGQSHLFVESQGKRLVTVALMFLLPLTREAFACFAAVHQCGGWFVVFIMCSLKFKRQGKNEVVWI